MFECLLTLPSLSDITGFLFLENTGYEPDPALQEFLKSGPPPIYIGWVRRRLVPPCGPADD
jgi:hypothetical protein